VGSRHPARAGSGVSLHLVPPAGRNDAGRDGAGKDGARDGGGIGGEQAPGPRSFRRYPLSWVLGLNGLTVVHYLMGCGAILVAYRDYPLLGWPVGLGYLVFAVVQLYVLMPLVVCPGCVYRTIRGGRCASGLNVLSARLCPPSPGAIGFEERAHGALCENSLCLWAWVLPVPLALPGLALSFSWPAFALMATVAALTVLRLAVVMRRVVCPHCLARRWCPVVARSRQAAA
jgi:hypothetical protein